MSNLRSFSVGLATKKIELWGAEHELRRLSALDEAYVYEDGLDNLRVGARLVERGVTGHDLAEGKILSDLPAQLVLALAKAVSSYNRNEEAREQADPN